MFIAGLCLFMSFFYNFLSVSVSAVNSIEMVTKQIYWTPKHLQVVFQIDRQHE